MGLTPSPNVAIVTHRQTMLLSAGNLDDLSIGKWLDQQRSIIVVERSLSGRDDSFTYRSEKC